tara:strand:+ start:755 stop:1159 length:405 start_codon:yes stop_codon:yes gene_type:complete
MIDAPAFYLYSIKEDRNMAVENLGVESLGIDLNINLAKLDKSRFVKGKNGAIYCNLTMFLKPDEPGQYGDHGGIQIKQNEAESAERAKMPYVGNGKVFWAKKSDGYSAPSSHQNVDSAAASAAKTALVDDDIPF